jgi:CDP-glycerol glycerophosphotransferase (TagB/SpsB family)
VATFSLTIESKRILIRQKSGEIARRLVLRHRLTGKITEVYAIADGQWAFDPSTIRWEPTYWDAYAYFPSLAKMQRVRLTKWWFIRGVLQHLMIYQNDDHRVYAYSAKGGDLSFSYRVDNGFTSKHNRLQYIALILAMLANIVWPFKRPWLIFEKHSARAQDAGAIFFHYMQQNQPQQNAYFLLDEQSPDWQRVRHYGKRLVKFGSFRHLYLLHRAKLYVSSESNGHAYFWRHNTGLVSNLVRIHPAIFLQHGVLGFKKLDKIFKAKSLSAPLLFITSSQIEREIVQEHLNYPAERVPVTGLARWDGIEPSRLEQRDIIMFFYTWRPWLDDVSTNELRRSEYFQHLQQQVTSGQLEEWAQAHQKEVIVVLHPKMAKMLPDKHLGSVTIVGDAEVPLRDLLGRVAVLVTDYSSLAWEAYYRDIPVIFDRFDKRRYQEAVGMYMTDAQVPFGVLADQQLVNSLTNIAEQAYRLSAHDTLHKPKYFQFEDNHNSQRVFQAIQDMSPALWWQWRTQLVRKTLKYFK